MRFLWVILCLLPFTVFANDEPFGFWLKELKDEAAKAGISSQTLNSAFINTAPIDTIITLDRKQPEGTKTLPEYLEGAVSEARINEGREQLLANHKLLSEIEKKYGVDKEIIVALWGIETNYGAYTGSFSTVNALATLAYDGRRSDYFRAELLNALRIIDAGHITSEAMIGSWAGAMGQCQFMPTSFLKYAVDYNHDGKRDIWGTQADVFASIANYLSNEGWTKGAPLALPINLPANFDMSLTDISQTKAIHEWTKLGVTYNDDSVLPNENTQTSVIMVGKDADAVPYLVYDNYKVILKWNRSRYFATSVDMLAEEIR